MSDCASATIALADGLIDAPVHLRGGPSIARVAGGLPPQLVEDRRHHLDNRRENRIARRGADRAMKPDVVQQKRLRVVERREHAR